MGIKRIASLCLRIFGNGSSARTSHYPDSQQIILIFTFRCLWIVICEYADFETYTALAFLAILFARLPQFPATSVSYFRYLVRAFDFLPNPSPKAGARICGRH